MSDDVHYEIILFWSEEDQAIIAEIAEVPGGKRTERTGSAPMLAIRPNHHRGMD